MVSIRCLLVDDSEDFLASASRLLESQGVDVVGRASNGEEALGLAESTRPNIVLVDVELGEEDGVELAHRLRKAVPSSRVILISAYDREEIADLLKSTRLVGFLPKSSLSAAAIAEQL